MIVKLGFCVAYDWRFLKYSLAAIYPFVDAICVSTDKDKKSWNGNCFQFDEEAFQKLLSELDVENKISLLRESFYSPDKSPIANECYQRKRMAESLGDADWIIQLDTDEIIINPDELIKTLSKYKTSKRAINLRAKWINLIKQTDNGFIYSVTATPPIATNQPEYQYGRTNAHFNITTDIFIAHITWARPAAEVLYKLKNWGHSHEFNGLSFYKIWEALDDDNWKYIKDFHPMNNGSIPGLFYQSATSLNSFVKQFDSNAYKLDFQQKLMNNIWVSRFKKVLGNIVK